MQNSYNENCSLSLDPDGKTLYLTGKLSFANAKKIHHELVSRMDGSVEQIDCSALEQADSTALALLLIATGIARNQPRELAICGLSSRLVSLADVYGIDKLLNVAT